MGPQDLFEARNRRRPLREGVDELPESRSRPFHNRHTADRQAHMRIAVLNLQESRIEGG